MEPSDLKKEIAEWIKYVRKIAEDLSQDELSEKTGIHKQQISRYERGLSMPRQKIIDKIGEYGGLPFIEFINERKVPYEIRNHNLKKLCDNVQEILKSGNEDMINLLKGNIKASLEAVRQGDKRDPKKEE